MVARKKILLVDDSTTVLLMERMLIGRRYDVVIANNGREAVEKAAVECPDLVLLDLVMPEMNGFEACRALRARPETERTPVIMVTTRGEPHNVEEGYAAGCSDYVTKPFDGVELMNKLRHYLDA